MNYKNLFKIIVSIADLHIGNKNISPEEYRYQIKNGILKEIQDMYFIDGIVLCGDTLHEKLQLDSEYSNIFFWFIAKIVKIAKKKNAFVRILKGTSSHDLHQLDNVKFYEQDEDLDFRVIDTKCIEEIDGHIYGYIPEEYVSDSDEYYKDFWSKPDNYFDMIFMHGLITECQFTKQDSENHNTKAPIFKTTGLMRITRGPVSAGHIHTYMNIKNKFFYVGSTLRTCHGEEQPKGFNIITYIQSTGLYRVDRLINEFTFNFNTLKIDSEYIEDHTVDEIVGYVDRFCKTNKVDKLSLKIKCIDYKETIAKIQLLKKYFSLNKFIKVSFKLMTQEAYVKEAQLKSEKKNKPYLEKGLTLIDQIKLWALEERKTNLDEKDIERFLTNNKLKREGI